MAISAAHSERSHALLSASGAKQWINCTPSVRLGENVPEEQSDEALEGTLAHEFADVNLQEFLGEIEPEAAEALRAEMRKDQFYSTEMDNFVKMYTQYVLEQLSEARADDPNTIHLLEQRTDFSHIVREGFGTNDFGIVSRKRLMIIDLKYGLGIKVFAHRNEQEMLYASGIIKQYQKQFGFQEVSLVIVQPRMHSISRWDTSVAEIEKWGHEVAMPASQKAWDGVGPQIAGDHCQWCKVKAQCPAWNQMQLDLAKMAFVEPKLLTTEELLEVYAAIPRISGWAATVKDYLTDLARRGETIPGFKIVEGQRRRRWRDPNAVMETLEMMGYENFTNTKIVGIGAVEGMMSFDRFQQLLGPDIITPDGKPTLVPETDPRPSLSREDKAIAMFDFDD